jgi:hypothetical protein
MIRWIIICILAGLSVFSYFLYSNASVELGLTQAELSATQTQLSATQNEMGTAKGELGATKTELEATTTRLATTETELKTTEGELQSAETELAAALDTASTVRSELDEKESELTELQTSYDGLMAGHGYTIKDPTYKEMIRFISDDDTDKSKYITGEYECTDFATRLCNNAEEKGIRCAYVSIRFPGGKGHAIVAFNTIDKGLIYIEPQYDDLVNIVIGKPFYKCVVPEEGVVYEKPAQDDTIEKVLVAW